MKSKRQKVYIAIAIAMIAISIVLIIYQNITGKNVNTGESGTRVFEGPITEMTIDIGSCEFEVIAADTTDVTVTYSNISGTLSDRCYDGRLSLTYKNDISGFLSNLFRGDIGSGKITITVPKDVCYEQVILEAGAAKAEIYGLCAKKLRISVGAGEMYANNIRATEQAKLEVGAGEFEAEKVTLRDTSLECGVGSMKIEGFIEGKSEIDCGVGSIRATIRGEESNYKGDLDCGIGRIVFGSVKIDGIGSEKTVANAGANSFEVDCGVGEVIVKFQK